jgi:hypothetical protein
VSPNSFQKSGEGVSIWGGVDLTPPGGRRSDELANRYRDGNPVAATNATGDKTQTSRPPRLVCGCQNAEITLARSAAPEAISRDATILVLKRHGYETVVEFCSREARVVLISDAELMPHKFKCEACI